NSTRVFGWAYDSADRMTSITYPALPNGIALTASYGYDAAWRPTRLFTSNWNVYLINNAGYTALDQPNQWTFANTLVQNWTYTSPMQRLQELKVGTTVFDRAYSYDNVGNVTSITDKLNAANNESFGYDHRNRLTSWTLGGATQSYGYDTIGNMTSKAGVSY